MKTYTIRIGWVPLVFGMAAIWVAVAGLQAIAETIAHAATIIQEIGEKPHG